MSTYSPEQWNDIADRAARLLVEEIKAKAGGSVEDLIILPLATVTQWTGVSRHTIPKRMAVTSPTPGKQGVTLKAVREHLAKHTTQPPSSIKP